MILINNKYKVINKIGSGQFGTIYKGENVRTKENVAIKIEPIKNFTKLLKNESIIYTYLKNTPGVPDVKWFGKDTVNYYMVIDLLGDSLQFFKNKNKKFSLNTTLKLGIQILKILNDIHDKGLIHRDIKPENFLLGTGEQHHTLYIIDFGLCKPFIIDNKHIELKKTNNMIGSLSYGSINAHNYNEQSRRDDIESLGYMLIFFYMGGLEWQNIESNSFEEKNNIIKNIKINMINNVNIQNVFINYFKYVRSIGFDEKPKYNLLINILQNEVNKL
jgi:serine/threonine protein kinase